MRRRLKKHCTMSLSARRAWIEIVVTMVQKAMSTSLSARRAWIEIQLELTKIMEGRVALRKESVDRNKELKRLYICVVVALRKESVDRNCSC